MKSFFIACLVLLLAGCAKKESVEPRVAELERRALMKDDEAFVAAVKHIDKTLKELDARITSDESRLGQIFSLKEQETELVQKISDSQATRLTKLEDMTYREAQEQADIKELVRLLVKSQRIQDERQGLLESGAVRH